MRQARRSVGVGGSLFTGLALLLVLAGGAPQAARAADAPPAPAEARAQAMKETLAVLQKELADHGGSYEKWGESLKPFREALVKIRDTQKWPWPAKNNFVFQGSEIGCVLLDTFDGQPEGQRPFDIVLETHKKFKEQGMDLIFAPLPDKLSIYPDYLSDTAPQDRMAAPAMRQLMKRLLENDVEVVDLYPVFATARKEKEDRPLYYDKDSHWRNIAAQIAGEQIAKRLMRYDFVQKALADGNRYSVQPEPRLDKPDQLLVVLDAKTKGRYADSGGSPILITGDSNLMYNMGAAGGHMPAQIGRHIGLPLDFRPNTIPPDHYGKLAGKRVVIWCNIGRMYLGLKWPKGGK